MTCLSHPDKRLIDHLNNVKDIGISIFRNKSNISFSIPNSEIEKALEIILFYHDFGKATSFFQKYLKCQIENISYPDDIELTYHSLISACVTGYKVYENMKNSSYCNILSLFSFITVRKHHGNFENLDEMITISKKSWKNIKIQWDNISDEFRQLISTISFDDMKEYINELLWVNLEYKEEYYLLLNLLFSILTYSDKTDVAIGELFNGNLPENKSLFIDNYKKRKFKIQSTQIDKIRNDVYNEAILQLNKSYENNKIFILNVPTGIGKTLTVLNLALSMIEKDNTLKRIIYALPFTSIVDQTGELLEEILLNNNLTYEDYLLIHHHLAEIKIKLNDNYFIGDKAQLLIENWDKPIIVSTFWQLFYSIISNENSQLRKFHNISNSVIILDEIQTIPYQYLDVCKNLLTIMTSILNCRIIFLTATMPLMFKKDDKKVLSIISDKKRKEIFSKFNRYKLNILKNGEMKIKDLTIDEIFEISRKDIIQNRDKSYMFVFNTIKSSIKFYDLLKNEKLEDKELIYLSTNILPIERKNRIRKIKENYKDKIIVSTQLIEAGVDINTDIIYRDFAPIDSLVQTAGRCNRHNNESYTGTVNIFKLKNENNKYDYNYIYKGLQLIATEEILSGREKIFENELLDIINDYYKYVQENHSKNQSNILLKKIIGLKYQEIKDNFQLIEEIPSVLIFVEFDENSSKLLNSFRNLLNIEDKFERKTEWLKIKPEFYQFVLSVKLNVKNIHFLNSFEELGNFKVLSHEMALQYYKNDTGLNLQIENFI